MFGRIILTALAAGLLSGVFIWGAHSIKTTPLILAAEVYENAGPASNAHSPDAKVAEAQEEQEEWEPGEGFERALYTLLADVLTGVGFAFLLVGAIHLHGRAIDWRQGVLWGLGGFAAFFDFDTFGPIT